MGGGFGEMGAAAPEPGSVAGSRRIAFVAFDTNVYLDAYANPEDGPLASEGLDAALVACRDRCALFQRALSRMLPDSDVSRAHASAPEPVPVNPETVDLVERARAYCARSEGCFDITMGTVTSLWDFHAGRVPSRAAVARALGHVDWRSVRADRAASTLAIADKDAVLDLGGIAKGYIADDLAALLESRGVRRFALNLGGNVVVRGGRPGGTGVAGAPWEIGIADPFDPARPRAAVRVADGSVATSGARERRFARGGRIYHHILDPRTGFPCETDVASATIVSDRSIDGDAYATTAFMLGMEAAQGFVAELDGVEAVLVGERGELVATEGLSGRVVDMGR